MIDKTAAGMSLRDYFAVEALAALLTARLSSDKSEQPGIFGSGAMLYAEASYRLADAMLKAREDAS